MHEAKIIQTMSSNHNRIELEINTKKKFGKFPYIWKLNTHLKVTHESKKKSQWKLDSTLN